MVTVTHGEVETALLRLEVGYPAALWGKAVLRHWDGWSVEGGEPLPLLPAIDALMGPADRPEAVDPCRFPRAWWARAGERVG